MSYSKIVGMSFLFLFIIGCEEITGNIIKIENLNERSKSYVIPEELSEDTKVFFCRETSCEKIYLSLLNSASVYAHCAFFEFNLVNLTESIKKRANEIDVKLVIDSDNYNNQFNDKMVTVDTGKQFSHNKFCVFDGTTVITGSFNPTFNEENKNDNNLVVIYSKYIAYNYENEFQELFSGIFGGGEKTRFKKIILNNKELENYFCPEDCTSQLSSSNKDVALYKIADLLRNAKHSIYFMAFSFTNEDIADAILTSNAGDIKGVIENRGAKSQYGQYLRLKEFGIDVKTDSNPATMHHKVFVIDKKIVITGSANPTSAGFEKNDENILIIHDKEIANEYLREYERVWGS